MNTPPPEVARRWAWRWLAYLVSMLALAWVVWLWWDHWPKVTERIVGGDRRSLVAGMALACLSGYANFVAFVILVRTMVDRSIPVRVLSNFYFVAQLLKHLPGRIWGVGYQAAMGREKGSASRWVAVNIAHMAAASYVALATAVLVLAWGGRRPWVGLLAVLAIALFLLLPRFLHGVNLITREGQGWRSRLGGFLANFRLPIKSWAWVLAAFLVSGVLHYVSWVMYADVIGLERIDHALALCAIYMLAWFVGYLAFLTPSGIGVRELVFVALSPGFPPEAVALMALVGRASFLAVDVILSLPFLLGSQKR